jgi:ornithine carbamoyltransferase
MKNLIRLSEYSKSDIFEIFDIADKIQQGGYKDYLLNKTVVLFFPNESIRTRVTYEKGIHLLGGQSILFPTDTLDKKEKIEDVVGYLNNWAECIVVRHKNIELIEEMARYANIPIINAMTNINHPCEVLSDLYALSKIRSDYLKSKYLFIGAKGNIGLAWKEASDLLGLSLIQSCPKGYEIENVSIEYDISKGIIDKDIILTDSLGKDKLFDFKDYQVSKALMDKANEDALLNPCPPFYRGEEVSEDVIKSHYFVGYEFKRTLLEVQQAIIIYNLRN